MPTPTASHLHRTLRANLDGHRASGDAFVASVYGEWGIDKTRCLKDVETLFQQELDNDLSGDFNTGKEIRLTVPVFFVPWQYEHEEHLVVPLLKTIEHRLRDLESRLPTRETKTTVRSVAGKIGDYTIALLSAFKFKLAPLQEILGMEVNFEPGKAIDETNKRFGRKPRPSFARYESLYFDTRSTLEEIIGEHNKVTFRFVLLIDDLDRCLPEKAIQMLESVKLFLNAPGFAFVLAVDDEVVERGIQHRYRDYVTKDGEHTHPIPVTGAQYLEKIVQLPVHLPRWSYSEAEAFLRESFPDYFGGAEANPPGAGRYQDLLKLLLRACPLVPRKLIRAVEGLVFIEERMRPHFNSLPLAAEWSARHALRLVLIQQLYPPFYRQMRDDPDSYWRLFRTRRDAHGHLVYGEEKHTLAKFKKQLNEAGDAADGTGDELTRTLQRYLQTLESAHGQRSGDPLLLVRPAKRNEPADSEERNPLSFAEFDAFYLHHLPLKERPLSFADTGELLPEAAIPDIDAFLEVLFLADGVQRSRALEELNLAGRRLPASLFRAICSTAALPEKHARLIDPDWLGDLDALLTPQQLADFYRATNLLSLLAGKLMPDTRHPPAPLITALERICRKLNPLNSPPSLIPLADIGADKLPWAAYRLSGVYLRGLNLSGVTPALSACDLLGCQLSVDFPANHLNRLPLSARIRRGGKISAVPSDIAESGLQSAANAAVISPDSRFLLTAHGDKTARLWDAASGKEIRRLIGHGGSVSSGAFSPDGASIATASIDNTARLWDAASGKEIRRLIGHDDRVLSVAFSPDGASIATTSNDNTARLWDAASGKEIRSPIGHGGGIFSVAFSPDGASIATASSDNTACLWDAASGKEIRRLIGHGNSVLSVAFSPDGASIATAGNDKTARLWDAASGKEIRRLIGHDNWVRCVTFSPVGASIATASIDKTARLWDAASGKEIRRLIGHGGGVFSATFSPDGASIVTASNDKTARLWDAASGKEIRRFEGHDDKELRAMITMVRDAGEGTSTYRRTDDQLWQTLERDGQTLPADPLLEQTLWFVDPAFGTVSLLELPQCLTWSADRKAVTVSRRPFEVTLENGELAIREL